MILAYDASSLHCVAFRAQGELFELWVSHLMVGLTCHMYYEIAQ